MFSSDNKSGYFGVCHHPGELTKPYHEAGAGAFVVEGAEVPRRRHRAHI